MLGSFLWLTVAIALAIVVPLALALWWFAPDPEKRAKRRVLTVLIGGFAAIAAGSAPAQSPWSDPSSWPDRQVPAAGADVVIPGGLTVLLDTTTAHLGSLHIEGTLVADDAADVHLVADSIKVLDRGTLQIGSAAAPFTHRATITLTGARGAHTPRTEVTGFDNDGVARGLMVMPGGSLLLFGAVPSRLVVPLGDHAASGATSLTLASAVDWKVGDRIAISKSDFYTVGATQILTLRE
jgi:hypothetical protein